jgi:hypothetical protein
MKLKSVEIHQVTSSTKTSSVPGTPVLVGASELLPHKFDPFGSLTTTSSEHASLSFRDPRRLNPYNVKALIGLDVDEIVPRFYGLAGKSEAKYYSLSMEKRTVVALIQLNPNFGVNETYSDLRDYLYKFIASSRSGLIQLKFNNEGTTVAVLTGSISKFESALSAKEPEVQITIECLDPWLKSPDRTFVDVSGFDPSNTIIVDELSTAPHGFRFEMYFSGPTPTFYMEDLTTGGWFFEVSPTDGFMPGDILYVSSEIGNRYVYMIRDGFDIEYLADVMNTVSVWPLIFPGENKYAIDSGAYMTWNAISYYHTYWGV